MFCDFGTQSIADHGGIAVTEDQDTIVVFTSRSLDRIMQEGGSQAWVLNPVNARQCRWLVCVQNRHNPDQEFADAAEPHGTAFLLGKISSVVHAPEPDAGDRWMVVISEFARISHPGIWDHRRNPVRYASFKQLGISLDGLEFQPMPKSGGARPQQEPHSAGSSTPVLTIAEAKKELAAAFGVRPEAIEITIRG